MGAFAIVFPRTQFRIFRTNCVRLQGGFRGKRDSLQALCMVASIGIGCNLRGCPAKHQTSCLCTLALENALFPHSLPAPTTVSCLHRMGRRQSIKELSGETLHSSLRSRAIKPKSQEGIRISRQVVDMLSAATNTRCHGGVNLLMESFRTLSATGEEGERFLRQLIVVSGYTCDFGS